MKGGKYCKNIANNKLTWLGFNAPASYANGEARFREKDEGERKAEVQPCVKFQLVLDWLQYSGGAAVTEVTSKRN
jgi:hypothetical protein